MRREKESIPVKGNDTVSTERAGAALALMEEALRLLDCIDVPANIGAQLQTAIDALENQL